MPLIPANQPQPGDYITYYGRSDNIIGGYIAERAISPLTGNPRYRVVDSMQEAKDEEAGRWIGLEETIAVNALPVNEKPTSYSVCCNDVSDEEMDGREQRDAAW